MVLSRSIAPMSTSGRSPVAFLPAELISMIFGYLYMDSRETCLPFIFDEPPLTPPKTKWRRNQDLRSPTLFPYALASVCTLWRDVLSHIPLFWTRIVIFVDGPPTPLRDIRKHLQWSRELTIEVSVIRRDFGMSVAYDGNEQPRVKAVMELLQPHIRRCKSLRFDVIHSSSLPSICTDFHGPAPILKTLLLDCKKDDGKNINTATTGTTQSAHHEEFFSPALQELLIDGRNFNWFCAYPRRSRMLSRVKCLTISHFTPSKTNTGESLSLPVVFDALLHIRNGVLAFLRFADVEFSDLCNPGEHHAFTIPYSSHLVLEDLRSADVGNISQLLDADPEVVQIARCPLDPIKNVPYSYYLKLQEIDVDQDLARYITTWEGGALELVACPGLTDAVLDRMSQVSPSASGSFEMEMLRQLCIRDCPNFTVGALKRMIEARRVAALNPLNTHGEFDQINELYIYGSLVLSLEDRRWFKRNVVGFYYLPLVDDV